MMCFVLFGENPSQFTVDEQVSDHRSQSSMCVAATGDEVPGALFLLG